MNFKKIIYLFLVVLGLHCCMNFSLVAVSRINPLIATCRLLIAMASLVVELRLQGMQASVAAACRLSSSCLQDLGHRFSSCGTGVQLLCGMLDLLRSGIKHVSPALAGRFFTTGSRGKPPIYIILFLIMAHLKTSF